MDKASVDPDFFLKKKKLFFPVADRLERTELTRSMVRSTPRFARRCGVVRYLLLETGANTATPAGWLAVYPPASHQGNHLESQVDCKDQPTLTLIMIVR